MTYELKGGRYRGRFADDLERDVALRWLDEAHGWFDELQGGEPRPGFALLESPLGVGLAKEVAPGRSAFRRRRRAARSFDDALALAAAGVATPRPLAALLPQQRRDPAAFVAELAELPTLAEWAGAGACGDRAALARACANTLARLHRAGLRHRDLKAPNILVDARAPGVVLIDLDGLRRRRPGLSRAGLRGRARDLARLLLSLQMQTDGGLDLERDLWVPLLAAYAERSGDRPADIDQRARRWAAAHGERNRRRGRPTA